MRQSHFMLIKYHVVNENKRPRPFYNNNNVAWTELPFSLTVATLMFRATLCNRHDYSSHFTDETAEHKEAQ